MSEEHWSEQHGREVILRWRRSGLSMSAYGREHGIRVQRISYWRQRVEGGGEETGTGKRETQLRLVPGVVVGFGDATQAPLRLVLPCGVVVEAATAEAVAPEWLAAVVRALVEPA